MANFEKITFFSGKIYGIVEFYFFIIKKFDFHSLNSLNSKNSAKHRRLCLGNVQGIWGIEGINVAEIWGQCTPAPVGYGLHTVIAQISRGTRPHAAFSYLFTGSCEQKNEQ